MQFSDPGAVSRARIFAGVDLMECSVFHTEELYISLANGFQQLQLLA